MSLTVASVWANRDGQKVCLIGDRWPPTNKGAHKKQIKLLAECLQTWTNEAPIAVLGEDFPVEKPTSSSNPQPVPNRLVFKTLRTAAAIMEDHPESVLRLCPSRVATDLTYFLIRCLLYWQPIGDEGTPEEDQKRQTQFMEVCRDVSWSRLFELCAEAVSLAREAARTFPPVASEWVEERARILEESIPIARAFCGEFAENTEEGYAATFFTAARVADSEALTRWQEWASRLPHCLRDLLFGAYLMRLLRPGQAAASLAGGAAKSWDRVVLFAEHNIVMSCAECLSSCGLQAQSFTGLTERINEFDYKDAVPAFDDRKILKAMLSNAFVEEAKGVETCVVCGYAGPLLKCSRCRTATYCNVNCQKSDWPRHKAECKKMVAANKGQASATTGTTAERQ